MREALILAGGAGTRLGELAGGLPKSLVDAGGAPFVDSLLWNLRRHGYDRIVFSLGIHGERFTEYLGSLSLPGVEIAYKIEPAPLGTGGALAFAGEELTGDDFLLLNGDTLFDFNYLDLALRRRERHALGALALRHVPDAARFGGVTLAGDSIAAFAEKCVAGPGLVSGGAGIYGRSLLERLPAGASSLERDILPGLAREGLLVGREYGGYFIDIGTPESLAAAQNEIPRWRHKPAVLFDRDGVLNVDRGHVHIPDEFQWMPGAVEAVKWLNDRGFLVFVITNQAGIAKGYYKESEYLAFERWIAERLAERGAHIDATYYCPHHPEGLGEYGRACDCRKPAPGLVLRAIAEWGLDPARTVFLGNSGSDLAAASSAGVRALLLPAGARVDDVVRRSIVERPGPG